MKLHLVPVWSFSVTLHLTADLSIHMESFNQISVRKHNLTTFFTTLINQFTTLISQFSLIYHIETLRRWTVRAQVDLACQLMPTFHVFHRLSAVMVPTLSSGISQFSTKKSQPFFQRMMAKAQFYQ